MKTSLIDLGLNSDQANLIQKAFSNDYLEKVNEYFKLGKAEAEQFEYYLKKLFPTIDENFSKRIREQIAEGIFPQYEYLILTVGFSPEPLALIINAFQPKKIFFLTTEESENILNKVQQLVSLNLSQAEKKKIEDYSSENIYALVKNIIQRPEIKENLSKLAIDVTGGKKSMGSNLALAGYFANIDTFYTDSELYLKKYRKPFPGLEKAIKLENPLVVFGDMEAEKGIDKFNRNDFTGAANIFQELKEKTREPDKYEVLYELSNAFYAYDNFNFKTAYELLDMSKSKIMNSSLSEEVKSAIQTHLQLLKPVKELQLHISASNMPQTLSRTKMIWHVLMNFYQCALRRKHYGRLDMAALLIYRALELLAQRRLAHIGINTGFVSISHLTQPDETPHVYKEYLNNSLPLSVPRIVSQFNNEATLVYNDYQPVDRIPKKLGLVNSMILLKSFGDPVFEQVDLQNLHRQVELRNHSILAHGLKTLEITELEAFEYEFTHILKLAWNVERVENVMKCDFSNYERSFHFPQLS